MVSKASKQRLLHHVLIQCAVGIEVNVYDLGGPEREVEALKKLLDSFGLKCTTM